MLALVQGALGFGSTPPLYGAAGCPCLAASPITSPPDETFEQDGVQFVFSVPLVTDASAERYAFKRDFGVGCHQHDQGTDPYCSTDASPDALPEFCSKRWCYVDAEDCDAEDLHSSFVPSDKAMFYSRPLSYSYETCGEPNLWDDWAVENLNPAS